MGHVWFKIGKWLWRKRFLNISNIILLIRYYLPLEKGVALHFNKLESPSPKDALCKVWLTLAQWIWIRRILNFMYFSLFRNYLPLEKNGALHLNKLESPSPKAALCQVWLKLAQWFWRRSFFFFNLSKYFCFLVIISLWKKEGPFI